jgi:hypothetical protein
MYPIDVEVREGDGAGDVAGENGLFWRRRGLGLSLIEEEGREECKYSKGPNHETEDRAAWFGCPEKLLIRDLREAVAEDDFFIEVGA